MPIPSKMADLFTLAASNSPAGSDAIGNSLDDYIRALSAIVRSTNANSSATLAAASTTDLGTSDGEAVIVTGSATITSFGTTVGGIVREVTFQGACTLTNSSGIQLFPAANYVTTPGDTIIFRSIGAGQWKQVTQPAAKYTAVNKAGDTMSGGLTIDSATNQPVAMRVRNTSNGAAAAGGYYFGSDLDANFAAYILLNSSGNTALGGAASLNIVQTQNAPLAFFTNNTQRVAVTATGVLQAQAALQTSGNSAVPANTGGASFFAGGFASPVSGRCSFGDGTGWQYRWSSRNASTYTDVMTLTDGGVLSTTGSVSAPSVFQTSDRRLKKRIKTFKPRDLSDVRITQYVWKASGLPGVSPIAQEVPKEYQGEDAHGNLLVDKAGLALERVAYVEALLKAKGDWS